MSKKAIVSLKKEYTQVFISEENRDKAIQSALWRSGSPHEWKWTVEEQANMALYVLWAAQRLEAIESLASGVDLVHEGPQL